MTKLRLPTVTLCAATSVNLDATIAALRACLDQVDFAECLLLTDANLGDQAGIRTVAIPRLRSSRDYSEFIIKRLADYVKSTHCLIVQWDGFVLNVACWDKLFLDFDYIGAPWPQFEDDRSVGNGGFSLRSLKLLQACRDPDFQFMHPEDLAICRLNRDLLETRFGIRFADAGTAGKFAREREDTGEPTFGFHGIFNMILAVGADRFWELYVSLDDTATAFVDFRSLLGQLGRGRNAWSRRFRLTMDWLGHLFARRSRR